MRAPRPAVLVVDDVETNLVVMEAVLEEVDCDVVRARSGNEALALLLEQEFAAMLLDVQMPSMDGFEVARHARSNPSSSGVPIIFVTAVHDSEEAALRGYGTGAVDFLFKPLNPAILRGKVRVFLELWTALARVKEALRQVEASHFALIETVAKNERLNAELQLKNKELESFSYSVSHDLRAPLRAVDGFSHLLEEELGPSLEGEAAEYLGRIRHASKRMGQIIDALLALAKVGRDQMTTESVDLSRLARSVVDGMRDNEPERMVELAVTPGLRAEGDRRLLRIILENLLGNAWKFTSTLADARIELGRTPTEWGEAFYVRDNGAGFDPAYAEKLFAPFQRLHTESEFPGAGIGLATVQRVVVRHGGRVWAEAAVGKGATFYFTLGGS